MAGRGRGVRIAPGEESVRLPLMVSASLRDALQAMAADTGESVAAIVRRGAEREVHSDYDLLATLIPSTWRAMMPAGGSPGGSPATAGRAPRRRRDSRPGCRRS